MTRPQTSAIDIIAREVTDRIAAADSVRRQIETAAAEAQARVQLEGERLARDLVGAVEGRVIDLAAQQIEDMLGRALQLPKLPTLPEFPPVPEAPSIEGPPLEVDARSRAGRTAIQGLVATLLLTMGTAVVEAVTAPGFGWTDLSAWRTAAMGAVVTGVMAGLAWIQRRTGH